MSTKKPTKAIIPVAGFGTRRLPLTKSIEKCMIPLLNRPIVDYIVEDCIKAGVSDIYFVVTNGSPQLKSYYEHNQALEEYLAKKNATEQLKLVKPPEGIKFHYIEQPQNNGHYGTTVPVWYCRDIVQPDESFLVIMGDQCLFREDGGSDVADLVDAVQTQGTDAGMVAVPVPDEQVHFYGIVAFDDKKNFTHIVDRPALKDAPSNLNNASIYLVPSEFWKFVQQDMDKAHDHGDEYKITDVLNDYVAAKHTITVSEAKGKYLDCGNIEGWVEANDYMLKQHLKKS
jgi:UTP--glucose-1-phosphate uridylyltransferase